MGFARLGVDLARVVVGVDTLLLLIVASFQRVKLVSFLQIILHIGLLLRLRWDEGLC